MSWATKAIQTLQSGKEATIQPRGDSMTPIISSGDIITLIPVTKETKIEKGDIVLCRVGNNHYLHLVKAIHDNRYQIGNNHGKINGWIGKDHIYGKRIANDEERNG